MEWPNQSNKEKFVYLKKSLTRLNKWYKNPLLFSLFSVMCSCYIKLKNYLYSYIVYLERFKFNFYLILHVYWTSILWTLWYKHTFWHFPIGCVIPRFYCMLTRLLNLFQILHIKMCYLLSTSCFLRYVLQCNFKNNGTFSPRNTLNNFELGEFR